MVHCHELNVGQVLVCEECGLQLQVVKGCEECAEGAEECACNEPCTFECCGEPLVVKEA